MRALLLALLMSAPLSAQTWFTGELLVPHSTEMQLPEQAHPHVPLIHEAAPTFVVSLPPEVLALVFVDNVQEVASLYGIPVLFITEEHQSTGYDPENHVLNIRVDLNPQGAAAQLLGYSDSSGVLYLNLPRLRANVERHEAARLRYGLSLEDAYRVAITHTLKHELLVHFTGFAVRTRMTVFKDVFEGYVTPGYLDSALPEDVLNLQTRELHPAHPFLRSAYWRALRLARRVGP